MKISLMKPSTIIFRFFCPSLTLLLRSPLFVTWKKLGELRGCIGTFSHVPLYSGLEDFALRSAFRDTRFPPIALKELQHLSCAVSILHNFEEAHDSLDWEVGKHGIIIEFTCPRGVKRNATYLPEVSSEQGWTKMEALVSLARKAGHVGKVDKAMVSQMKLTRYESSKVHASYGDYLASKVG